MAKKVVILGGGIAGMSAAHELIERGFTVEIYERQSIPGGKARSIPVVETFGNPSIQNIQISAPGKWSRKIAKELGPTEKRPWLPGEHGFRFFPSFYRHITATMERIPYGNGKVSDNLVDTSQLLFARFGREGFILPSRFPRTLQDIKSVVDYFLTLISKNAPVPLHETEYFGSRVWQVLTSSHERRLHEYEKISWWEFVGAEQRSEAYQKFFAHGLTRLLVASQAHLASTWTIGNIHLQLLLGIANPAVTSSDRLLNGPTNLVWIEPWLNYLKEAGVKYYRNCFVRSFACSDGTIRNVTVEKDGRMSEVRGDFYVAALPLERLVPLITPGMKEADPHLGYLEELSKNVEWMNGIQFYLTCHLPIVHGHVTYIDSLWALTSISQAQFWSNFDMRQFGGGQTRDILSICISDWNTPGLNGKRAKDCTAEEIASEVWEQLKTSLNNESHERLRDEHLYCWFLDSDIQRNPHAKGQFKNLEPLFVNLKDTWHLRPDAVTKIPNFFLASDYVRTFTDLATMEAANEAARRVVNGILEAAGSNEAPCQLWNLEEPEILQPLREYDRIRWESGLPWDERLTTITLSVLEGLQNLAGLSSQNVGTPPLEKRSPDLGTIPRKLAHFEGPNVGETLLQVSKQILSMVEGEQMSTNLPGLDAPGTIEGHRNPSKDSDRPGQVEPLPRRGRLRIVQKE